MTMNHSQVLLKNDRFPHVTFQHKYTRGVATEIWFGKVKLLVYIGCLISRVYSCQFEQKLQIPLMFT